MIESWATSIYGDSNKSAGLVTLLLNESDVNSIVNNCHKSSNNYLPHASRGFDLQLVYMSCYDIYIYISNIVLNVYTIFYTAHYISVIKSF